MNAAAVLALMLTASPDMVFVKESIPVVFTARITGPSGLSPDHVKLMRLEGSGSESESCVMKADSALYTCSLRIKERNSGILSFTAEASYADRAVPLRSRPVFITVVGGTTAKERKSVLKLQRRANAPYESLAQQKRREQARKETVAWLVKQPGVVSVRTAPSQNLSVQLSSGITLWVKAPLE